MKKLYLLLNCIKNGQKIGQNCILFDYSNFLYLILNILVKEGFLKGFLIKKKNYKKEFCILLKYKNDKSAIKRICIKSKSIDFFKMRCLSKASNGIGFNLVSTSKGLMTSESSHYMNFGGRFLFSIQ
jgi:small subunit ribosomal protein S8